MDGRTQCTTLAQLKVYFGSPFGPVNGEWSMDFVFSFVIVITAIIFVDVRNDLFEGITNE